MGFDLRRRIVCLAAGGAALLASGAVAAQASAASLTLNAGCYVNFGRHVAQVTVTGSGFVPSTDVILGGDVFGANVTTDALGDFTAKVDAPNATINPGARKFKVTASTDDITTGQTVSAQTFGHYTEGGVSLSANTAGFGKRLTYSFGGFRPGRQIWGHYFIGKRSTGRHRFGKAKGPCGTLKAKATGYPVSRAHPNKWIVYYDDVKKFSKKAIPTYILHFHKI